MASLYLKRILLDGFKSFADRTEFDFGPGLTVVVGPNGCGKSNVLDAARWVLGEQSAKTLRGSKMLDVIFSGSRTRKAAASAHVELVLDNSAGRLAGQPEEVTVSRTLFTTGESEYRINGDIRRLKDIRDLLLDTGVGVDAYSFIEQNRVDLMLQASPVERREIFEEAAGISRYKVRRVEAQRKLERTQQNLLRLGDLIEELEKRLRSVKLAAGKARSFQEYDAKLRELRSAFSLSEYHRLDQLGRSLAGRAQSLGDVLAARRAELEQREGELRGHEELLQAVGRDIELAEAELARVQSDRSTAVERVSQIRRRIDELREDLARSAAEARDAEGRIASLRQRVEAEERSIESLGGEERERREAVVAARARQREAQAQVDEARRAIDQARSAVFEAARQLTLLANEIANIEQQQGRLAAQRDGLAARRETLAAASAQVEQRRSAVGQQLAEIEEWRAERMAALQDVSAAADGLVSRLSEAERHAAQLKEERSAVLSRRSLLDEQERRLEGVGAGSRWALALPAARESRVVLGLVADVLRIDDPRVHLLQPILSAFEHQVVVSELAGFTDALREAGEPPGPLTVVALDRLPAVVPLPPLADRAGVVARAADWVRCEERFRRLAEWLLGRVFIVDDVSRAVALAGESLPGCWFVSLDGWAVSSDGRMDVGLGGAVEGLITRRAEIRQLQLRAEQLDESLAEVSRRVEALHGEIRALRGEGESLSRELTDLDRQHAATQADLIRAEEEQKRNDREAALLQRDAEEAERTLVELATRRADLEQRHGAAQHAHVAHEEQLARVAGRLADRDAELRSRGQEVTAAEVEAARAAERHAAAVQSLRDLRAAQETAARQFEAAKRIHAETEARIAAAGDEAASTEARIERLAEAIGESEQRVAELRGIRDDHWRRIEVGREAARECQAAIEEVDVAFRECEVGLREAEIRKEDLAARVRDELAIDLAALYASYVHSEQDWEAIRAEIEQLRQRIARLGHVNLDALAELEELQPRYDGLMVQRADLNESIAKLEALIAELDEEARSRFVSTFEEVRTNFQELFRKTFGGGKADVILEDPERPLECGIEVIARPPGKEPQSISLLSGGEKSMTAVALLFAIFRSRPSPFAILDEVDAALDEANVDRFNTLLEEFIEQSQFIVISHNKRTMQRADTLYGVTMDEPGVSKRVSVRFHDRVGTSSVA